MDEEIEEQGTGTLDSVSQRTWERLAQRRNDGEDNATGTLNLEAWTASTMEIDRDETHCVRITRWTRGDEIVITLQWMEFEDNRWKALNTPLPPGYFD